MKHYYLFIYDNRENNLGVSNPFDTKEEAQQWFDLHTKLCANFYGVKQIRFCDDSRLNFHRSIFLRNYVFQI